MRHGHGAIDRAEPKSALAHGRGRNSKSGKTYKNIYKTNTIYIKWLLNKMLSNTPNGGYEAAPKGYIV